MNTGSKTFHVLYLPDGLVSGCIDAIRLLANPAEKYRAHITIRGPYQRGMNPSLSFNRFVEGFEFNINGPGNFFEFGQNTVYLKCTSSKLKDAWYKPDYGFNPHITLYDGDSHEFAERLWNIIASWNYEISFVAGPLKSLVSSRPHQSGMGLPASLDARLIRDVTNLDVENVTSGVLQENQRLEAIGKLCEYLSTINSRMSSPIIEGFNHTAADIDIQVIDVDTGALSGVKALAKKYSSTLGFLPEGAIDTYAHRGWILAAMSNGVVMGYVVYRKSQMKAVLVHLCVDEQHRGQGIAKRLFRYVVDQTNELRGILANTRRDFPAHTMWPRLGFTAVGEIQGRAKKPSVLTRWWYEHQHPTLFTNNASYQGTHAPIDIAIDLGVFFDLVTRSPREVAKESRSIQSDWLLDEIELCVTGELFNEINTISDQKSREELRKLAQGFKWISGTASAFEEANSSLSTVIGGAKDDQLSSDLRHLAHAAAADVEFFVTLDDQILRFQREIESETGVVPMRPSDLAIEIDQIRNATSYQPIQLRGTQLRIRKVQRQERKKLIDIFLNKAIGETRDRFRETLSSILPSGCGINSELILNDREPIALIGKDLSKPGVLTIPCLRLRYGRLARTLAREIVNSAVDESIKHERAIVAVTDDWLDPLVDEALAEGGFAKEGARWLKFNYPAIGTENDVADGFERLLKQMSDSEFDLPGTIRHPLQPECQFTSADTVLVEKKLRPLKLTNGVLDTFVIPVLPIWAEHLFDSRLAEQTLFGARPDLLLSWENAYYRSPRSFGNVSAPFRILWYVSQDGRYVGTGRIRAYSVGSSVEVLSARAAHSRYKRLGVYDWHQVLEISGGDPEGRVMVIRFRDTELFDNPIDRGRFSALLASSDRKKPILVGPQRISESAFADIYKEGQSWL